MTLTSLAVAVAVLLVLVVLFRNRSDSLSIDVDTATQEDMRALAAAGHKIDAIKVYRRLHRVDLKTAKEAVERLIDEMRPPGRG